MKIYICFFQNKSTWTEKRFLKVFVEKSDNVAPSFFSDEDLTFFGQNFSLPFCFVVSGVDEGEALELEVLAVALRVDPERDLGSEADVLQKRFVAAVFRHLIDFSLFILIVCFGIKL